MILMPNSMFSIILYQTQNVNLDKNYYFERMHILCHRTGTKVEKYYIREILSPKTN